jgi:hypothetical protein
MVYSRAEPVFVLERYFASKSFAAVREAFTIASGRRVIALVMEAARTSETLVNFYQTTPRYNPEDSHFRTHRRENLKSYFYFCVHNQ